MDPICLLVGGRSTEHDASIHSYLGVLRDLVRRSDHGIELRAVYFLDRDGAGFAHRAPPWPGTADDLAKGEPTSFGGLLASLEGDGHFVFSLLHGNEGEDGAWQGLAEIRDLRGSFGPVFAACVSMNKWAQSVLACALCPGELEMPRTWRLDPFAGPRERGEVVRALAGRRCVVKPNRMGASLLTEVYDDMTAEALESAYAHIAPYDSEVLVQEFVAGTEYTCGCVERAGGVVSLPVIEARTERGFLGHAEKHCHGLVEPVLHLRDTPATEWIKRISERLFRAFGIFGMARFDYIVAPSGTVYYLEVNSLPGLMGGSAFPKMLRAAEMDLADLIRCCIEGAARVPPREKRLPYLIDEDGPAETR